MSGHSKWHKIKHQKEATDKKKSKIFGQLARDISIAARDNKDPAQNATLRDAIARAKKANMPGANIDRLLAGKDTDLANVTYEAIGPGGSFLLIFASTDNLNRTVSEVRALLKNHGGTMGKPGSARWKFTDDGTPTYSTPLNPTDYAALQDLITQLQQHPDIQKIVTDATPA